jgi:SsrA-binding protein
VQGLLVFASLCYDFTIPSRTAGFAGRNAARRLKGMAKKDASKSSSKGKAPAADSGIKTVARNRKARHEYELLEKVEAGLVLTGTEVKSLRNGKANLEDAYAEIDKGEVWLLGCDIPEYLQANRMNHVPKRRRKLLLHRREIAKLDSKSGEKGLTLVPLSIYFKKGIAKVELSVARGRKTYDKREAIKKQDAKRDMDRASRRR